MSICSGAGTTPCIPARRRTCAAGCGSTGTAAPPAPGIPGPIRPRELAGVWRTEGRGEALRLEYAVKRLSRQGKLALLHQPETAADLLPGVAAEPVPGVTLAMCLEGEFHE